jgi:sialic acid synthase SpsE
VIEKHVKLDGVESHDSQFSMTMDAFADMVINVKNAKKIANGPEYSLSKKEKESTIFRRSLYAVKDIEKGEIISKEAVRSIRPGYGIAPKNLCNIIGKKSPCKLHRGEPITAEILEALK